MTMLSGTNTGVNGMYARAGAESNPADTGRAFGSQLSAAELSARTRYAPPGNARPEEMLEGGPKPSHVNLDATQPVKYDVPSYEKENFVNKAAIRDSIKAETGKDVVRVDNIGDDEVAYLAAMKSQGELADFDRYVNSMIDPRQPGNLKWLMEIYPQFVDRRIKQVHTDYEFALRNQLIDSWGVNTFDDLHFKYLVDQGKIDGPELKRAEFVDDTYADGFLSPARWLGAGDNRPMGLRLPFASAKTGKKPADPSLWEVDNENQPLGKNRTTAQLARGMQRNGGLRSMR
jgi:hypothetical protein